MEFSTDFVKADQAMQFIGMKSSANDERKANILRDLGAECAFVPGKGSTGKQLMVRVSTLQAAKAKFEEERARRESEAAKRIENTQFVSYQHLCQEFRAMREEFLSLAEKIEALLNRGTH